MRRLIINGDDFGLTAGVNRGILECIRQGVVTSATLMAVAAGLADALQKLDDLDGRPRLSVGCHVVLVDGNPLLPPGAVSSLIAARDEFHPTLAAFAQAAFLNRLDEGQIASEAEAQIRKAQGGVRLSHVDTHKHVHLFPAVLRPLLRAARKCGVRAVRNPFAPVRPLAFAHLFRRPHLWKRYTEVKVLRAWTGSFRRTVAAEGLLTTDGTFGIVSTGALDLRLFEAIIGCIPEGTWELCCHPGYNDAELAQVHTRLRESRDQEREVLTSAAAREILDRHGIELINFWDL